MSKEDYYKTYIFEYPYNGARWAFELMATSPEDAEARFKALPWGKYSGELKFRADVPDPSFIIRLWRRLFKGGQ
jgi:hypothetical protein